MAKKIKVTTIRSSKAAATVKNHSTLVRHDDEKNPLLFSLGKFLRLTFSPFVSFYLQVSNTEQ
jgi:hypothetical protein